MPADTHAAEAQSTFEIVTVKDALPGNEYAWLIARTVGLCFHSVMFDMGDSQ